MSEAPSATGLEDWLTTQIPRSAEWMLSAVSRVDLVKERPLFGQRIVPLPGSILASPVDAAWDPEPDYFFHWFRDAAVILDAIRVLALDGILSAARAKALLHDSLTFAQTVARLQGAALADGAYRTATRPEGVQYLRDPASIAGICGLRVAAETRVNADGTFDITTWARPQTDGPALRALTHLRWDAQGTVDEADRPLLQALIAADLAVVEALWAEPSFDPWEEECGTHYYTRLLQAEALERGADWLAGGATDASPTEAKTQADRLRQTARTILDQLESHWTGDILVSRQGIEGGGDPGKLLDIAVILGVVHAAREGDRHGLLDPRIEATFAALEALFRADYPINHALPPGRGPAFGRYRTDAYFSGGAFYFSTFGAAEYHYHRARLRNDPASLAAGDAILATTRAYAPADGDMAEQFDKTTGAQSSARTLAWSHAGLITAASARRRAQDHLGGILQ
ncbi:glycoside hydrolase family 15 protein [Rhodospirillum rubrum]|uniref:glucan 1,4-alpha-glucosidase n=1 Tax=Rhodospirillum rubrum (strain ATCC 11170 / ATH 1.1.1 / DSM 467 / LMG 4362 / NCIMB 8255 / S1) TaxID=269796 RepID=Q2RP48_RHORT|nr:glycoside hydrolase family 15 protein [Rhodospirillum rubrum]ABC24097.1 Glucan 1,4-alpha-glucosidase [Rhodospirillum rubrum ATCC 11170]AEO49843.1 glucan 1,4-alpha-glucosidase [Rhodospirillum rubrum F11]MBK5955782.1 glucan 1,4-alpha-glucosidase [Rhodospirillum rubrum]QXG80039.1 glycoside hydrolase family 15 protein [Rhodospirillum rubrum]HAP99708.1 glucan 1,4-alpha-glucosidase [Rhodospirillum rubrum]